MENKKLGVVLICISLAVGGLFLYYISTLTIKGQEIGCYPDQECIGIEHALNASHIAIGIFSFIFALGFYMLIFNKTEQAILRRLEQEKNDKVENARFEILLKALDPYEKKVVQAIREQPGVTQSTLRIRVEMSKAKLSYVLQELEKRGIIKRIEKGKTLSLYLMV